MRSKVPGISRLPGRTLADLAVQARAVIPHVWATGTYGKDGAPDADENINKEAMRSLIENCCAAAGVDWRGATVGETSASEPVDADCADQRDPLGDLLAGLDLSAVPMRTLSALHDHVEALNNICYGLAAQPRSLHDGRTLNEAGVVLDRLAEGLLQGPPTPACARQSSAVLRRMMTATSALRFWPDRLWLRGNDEDHEAVAPESVVQVVTAECPVIPLPTRRWGGSGNVVAAAGVALLNMVAAQRC